MENHVFKKIKNEIERQVKETMYTYVEISAKK